MAGALMLVIVVTVIVLLMLIFWIISAYNRMVDLRNEVENQYQNLETQIGVKDQKVALVEETDLAQLGLESAVYDKIIDARKKFAEAKSSGNRGDMMAANGLLDSVIPQVLAFAEDNPQLTSHNVLVAGLEEGVQAIAKMANEVEEYNQAAKNYNTVTEMFPTLLVARMFGFERADLFDIYSSPDPPRSFKFRSKLIKS
ncbi:MAG TPA: LemA family protein, partial [Candidatus Thalassarchaeaceae archaeon]|nr:LemA family protein [Candidatus Thalassarchaeaceae archaeon]